MGTIHKPEAPVRELTKTEIDIAVAQIADRLTRFLHFRGAAAYYFEELAIKFFPPNSTADEELQELKLNEAWNVEVAKLRDEFQIPDGMCKLIDGDAASPNIIKTVSKARKWVKGIMSPADLSIIWEEAVDIYDYNIGWVFMETPTFGSHVGKGESDEAAFLKFMEIGCRNFIGSKLINVSGPGCSLIRGYEMKWNSNTRKGGMLNG